MKNFPGSLARLYRLISRAYPPGYHATFGDEMYLTFLEGVTEARSQGSLVRFTLREFRDLPGVLLKAYLQDWIQKWRSGVQLLRESVSDVGLPPPLPDGRHSWRQAGLELSLFLLAGIFLILATYLPMEGLRPAWQRDPGFLGTFILPLTLPVVLLGLLKGLPRWVYPFGGLLIGYEAFAVNQSGFWPFLLVMLIAALILGFAALIASPRPALLPISVRRIGQSLFVDWTRLSFGFYGAVPLAILMAFDDAHANNQTPYFALSVLVMLAAALVYTRSRQPTIQTGALLAGSSLSIWLALLDKAAITGRMGEWISRQYPGPAEVGWLLQVWIFWSVLILAPALLTRLSHAFELNRAIE